MGKVGDRATGEDCFSWWGRKEINADQINELMVCVCLLSTRYREVEGVCSCHMTSMLYEGGKNSWGNKLMAPTEEKDGASGPGCWCFLLFPSHLLQMELKQWFRLCFGFSTWLLLYILNFYKQTSYPTPSHSISTGLALSDGGFPTPFSAIVVLSLLGYSNQNPYGR